MNVGIVVEGQNDFEAYPRLIRRIRSDINKCQVRSCGGKSKLKHGFVNFLKEFQRNSAWQINAAFVIRDSDCSLPQPIEDQLEDILETAGFSPEFHVDFFAIPCTIESWLLSDLGAFPIVAAQRGYAPDVPAIPLNVQIANSNSSNDKKSFTRVLTHFGLPATPVVYGEVAATASLAVIANRCPYFTQFIRRIKAF